MSKNSYPCFKCKEWFETSELREAHKCGKRAKPKKQEVAITIDKEISKDEVSSEKIDKKFNRKEAIASLIGAGIFKDRRSTTNKSDEELMRMLKDIEA